MQFINEISSRGFIFHNVLDFLFSFHLLHMQKTCTCGEASLFTVVDNGYSDLNIGLLIVDLRYLITGWFSMNLAPRFRMSLLLF